MSDSISTQLDETVHVSADTRATAVRVIRAMAADADLLLDMLGLDDTPPPPGPAPTGVNAGDGTLRCSGCHQRTRPDGICRRKACRARDGQDGS